MTTQYFIMTKSPECKTYDNEKNQIIYLNNQETHILPQVNLHYYATQGLFESQLIEWCKQFLSKDTVFLDIGAHSGTYSISLSAYAKQVYSFEPQKMTYYSLCGGVALSGKDNITCLKYGLGSPEQVGQQTLKIVSNDGGGSSLHSVSGVLREETIEVKTLDDFAISDIGFIKMDVEENELYVLKGATETLKRSNYPTILFESNFENVELFDYIKEIGYNGIIPVGGCKNMYLTQR
jgi:FkbM family methyltransferase